MHAVSCCGILGSLGARGRGARGPGGQGARGQGAGGQGAVGPGLARGSMLQMHGLVLLDSVFSLLHLLGAAVQSVLVTSFGCSHSLKPRSIRSVQERLRWSIGGRGVLTASTCSSALDVDVTLLILLELPVMLELILPNGFLQTISSLNY